MGTVQAMGGAPISFVDGSGVQYVIPLTFVTYSPPSQTPDASGWLLGHPALASGLNSWLQTLAAQGALTASAVPTNPPAFSIAARDAGSTGKNITMAIANVVANGATPGLSTMDISVSTTQTYMGLTLATIAATLGTTAGGGTIPGLAYVGNISTDLPTLAATAANFSGTPAKLDVASSGGTAFTLFAVHDAADAALLQASISAVDTGAGTFTLVLEWKKSVTGATLQSLSTTFSYLLTLTPPAGGFVYPPAAGTITLLGGTNPTASVAPATAAQAIVVAG